MTSLLFKSYMLKRRFWTVAIFFVLSSASVAAHDMWIEPSAFAPSVGRIVGLRLRVGEDLIGHPIPRNPELIDQFISLDSTGRKPIFGRNGADPAGLVRVSAPGLIIVGYSSNPSPVVLPAAQFSQYLKEEGLETVAEFRARRGETGKDGREVFSRGA